jgi:hypothetical protein
MVLANGQGFADPVGFNAWWHGVVSSGLALGLHLGAFAALIGAGFAVPEFGVVLQGCGDSR